MELFSPPWENFLYFRKRKPRKNFLYFLRETEILKNYLHFRKRNFLIFQERYIQNPGITELFYISERYVQKPGLYRTRSIFRTLLYSEPETYSEHCQISTRERFVKTTKKNYLAHLKKVFIFSYISGNGTF